MWWYYKLWIADNIIKYILLACRWECLDVSRNRFESKSSEWDEKRQQQNKMKKKNHKKQAIIHIKSGGKKHI